MKANRTLEGIALVALMLSTANAQFSTLFAQGTAFTYQGRFQTNGVPYSGPAEFQFTLWDAASGGAAVATNNPPSVVATVAGGLFTVTLDFGISPFNGQSRFLQIDARTAIGPYTPLSPRQPVTATPYAIFSSSAASMSNGVVRNPAFLGTVNNAPLDLFANNQRGLRIVATPNSVNVIEGIGGNSVAAGVEGATIGGGGIGGGANRVAADFGTIGGGYANLSSNNQATVGGGGYNVAAGVSSTVGGGFENRALHNDATVAGGYTNTASGFRSTVGGGAFNAANNQYAVVAGGNGNEAAGNASAVGGGYDNTATGSYSTVSGGNRNAARETWSTVGGGVDNTASGSSSTVGGGSENTASGQDSTVPGGGANMASGDYSFAAGLFARASHDHSFVWSDGNTTSSASDNSVTMRASGGFRFFTASGAVGARLNADETSWTTISDRNVKKNFAPVNGAAVLEKLAALPVQSWNYKWESDTNTPHFGPMAQDFKAAFYPGRDDKSISTLEFDGVELAAIQGLNQKLSEQEAVLKQKDSEIQELRQAVAELQKTIRQTANKTKVQP